MDLPYDGEGGLATSALLDAPIGVAIDVAGNLYLTDSTYDVVRKVTFNGATPSASVTSAPAVEDAPSAPVASTPTLFISAAPTVSPSTSISMAPTLHPVPPPRPPLPPYPPRLQSHLLPQPYRALRQHILPRHSILQ